MPRFEPQDPDFEARVRASFARQKLIETLGAKLVRVEPGFVEVEMPFAEAFTQQHGFVHAGVVTSILDSACGYAAFSLMPPGAGVLTVEYKVNLVAPAAGEAFRARGRVLRPGRTLSVSAGDVFAVRGGEEKLCATMLATIIRMSTDEDPREGGSREGFTAHRPEGS